MFFNALTSSMTMMSVCAAASNSVFDDLKALAGELNKIQITEATRPALIQRMTGALTTLDQLKSQGRLVPKKISTESIRDLLGDPQRTDEALQELTQLIRSISPTRPDIPQAKAPSEEDPE